MAEQMAMEQYVTFIDAANRTSTWAMRCTQVAAQIYVAAADAAARSATSIGATLAAVMDISELTPTDYGVRYAFYNDAASPPAGNSGALRGNKVVFGYSGSGRNFVTSIPGRDDAELTLTNGTEVVLADAAAVAAFVSAIELSGRDINGNAITVTYGRVND